MKPCARCGKTDRLSTTELCIGCGLVVNREKRTAELAALDAKRIARFESMEDPEAAIARMFDDYDCRDAIERHLASTWSSRRPDIIEFFIAAATWQRHKIEQARELSEAAKGVGETLINCADIISAEIGDIDEESDTVYAQARGLIAARDAFQCKTGAKT